MVSKSNFRLTDGPGNLLDRYWRSYQLPDASLLWKIPAFCTKPASYLVPGYWLQQAISFQLLGGSHELNDTRELWKTNQVRTWTTSDDSALLIVQGRYDAKQQMGKFTVEMIDYLAENQQQIAWLLNYASSRGEGDDSDPPVDLSPSGVLRQLAIQLLTKIHSRGKLHFLALILELMQAATTCEEWFTILETIITELPGPIAYVVIDLRILGSRIEEAQTWPSRFEKMFETLQRMDPPSTLLKVCLVNHGASLPVSASTESSVQVLFVETSQSMLPANNLLRKHRLLQSSRQEPQFRPPLYDPTTSARGERSTDQDASSVLRRTITKLNRDDFEVAIFCALPLEADAVSALFDTHLDDEGGGTRLEKLPGDRNAYSAGVMGPDKVILVHMPGMGKVSAAIAAATCRLTFPNIKLALVVGICGAVPLTPNGDEIILGDVVISEALVQYDIGRRMPGRFLRKDTLLESLGRPNVELRGILARLRGVRTSEMLSREIAEYMEVLRHWPKLGAIYPGCNEDRLFASEYSHQMDNKPCEEAGCDGNIVPRQRLQQQSKDGQSHQPMTHIGLVASGDSVMKSGEDRDAVAKEEGIIAFEMEGAGIWDTYPCVVIKGVCDYADSHKSKVWQRYAAATAAACMKSFLSLWASPGQDIS